jgi:hypothetical protein
MVKPKRGGYERTIHKAAKEIAVVKCANPQCDAKIAPSQVRKGRKYCDRVCQREHNDALKKERRPAEALCTHCGKAIDVMREKPAYWATHSQNFCDSICCDAYRRQTGWYKEIGRAGNAKAQEYKAKHGRVINHENRSRATSRSNREAPPKAKHFVRHGKAWGYDVVFSPHDDGQGYNVVVPELNEELGAAMYAKTVKEGLKLVREKVLELRAQENKGETKQ